MDVIGQYYAPHVKSKKERIKSKDRVDTFDQASWDEYDIRVRRLFALEKRLADLREDPFREEHTPVYKVKEVDIHSWVGAVAQEQDTASIQKAKPDKAINAYKKLSENQS